MRLPSVVGTNSSHTLLSASINALLANYPLVSPCVTAEITLHASPHSFLPHHTRACLVTAQLPPFGQLNGCTTTVSLSEQANSGGSSGGKRREARVQGVRQDSPQCFQRETCGVIHACGDVLQHEAAGAAVLFFRVAQLPRVLFGR